MESLVLEIETAVSMTAGTPLDAIWMLLTSVMRGVCSAYRYIPKIGEPLI